MDVDSNRSMTSSILVQGTQGNDERVFPLKKEFRPGEFLVEISGFSNPHGFVTSLNFRTNLYTRVPQAQVPEDETPFSVPVMNGKIVGFFGRSGDVLHAIVS